jgi:HD-like signal output (HDOD) protein
LPDGIRRWWVPVGPPVLEPPAPADANAIDRELYQHCIRTLDDPNIELPQISVIVQQVLMMLHSDDVDLRQAADLASRDPALTADVLRLVNSAQYRGVAEINRLEQAFVRLGVRAVRSLLLTCTAKQVAIRVGGERRTMGEELWRRSLAAGILVSALSPRYDIPEEDGFLIGLLHDIGRLAILKVVYDFQRLHGRRVTRAVFDRVCDEWHEHLGQRLAGAWGLPDPIPELCGSHHRVPAEDDPLKTQRYLLQLADAACAMLEYAPYVPYDFFCLPCVRGLGLEDTPETHRLLANLPDLLRERMELF